ncbi:hypothetical protein JTB14_025346 [Gonioctena quinquepunctata]|nr:hypothetical protein JTB14_025346 [Gonioctena quinquepunctata]
MVNQNINNPTGLWKSLKIINGKQAHNDQKSITIADGIDLRDKKEIAEHFADHYAIVGKKLAVKLFQLRQRTNTRTPNSIFIEPVITKEIHEIIQSLKTGKAPGLDNIKSEILREHSDLISVPPNLYNKQVH